MQAIIKLAFFAASKNEAGGYENTNCVYLPALRTEEKEKSEEVSALGKSGKIKKKAESRATSKKSKSRLRWEE